MIQASMLLLVLGLTPFADTPADPKDGSPGVSRLSALDVVVKTKMAADEVAKGLAQARQLASAGKVTEALKSAMAADELARRVLPVNHRDRTRSAVFLAVLRYQREVKDDSLALKWASDARQASQANHDPKAALQWAGIAQNLAKKALKPDDPEVARVAIQLESAKSIFSLSKNDLAEAKKSVELAVNLAEKGLKPGEPDRSTATMLLAKVKFLEGDRAAAESLFAKVLAECDVKLAETGRSRVEALCALMQLKHLRAAADARATSAQCLSEAIKLGDPVDPLAIEASQIVSNLVWSRLLADGQKSLETAGYAKAEAALKEQVARFRTDLQTAGADKATARLGDLFIAKFQNNAEHISDADKTLTAMDRDNSASMSDQPLFEGDYWTLRGLVATDLSNYADARDFHERAFQSYYRGQLPQQAIALNNLGLLLLRQGDYENAESILREAYAASESDPALKGDPQQATIFTNLAKCLELNDNLPEARELHDKALKIARTMKPPRPFLVVLCLANVGLNRYLAGDFAEAGKNYEEARQLAVTNFGAGHFRVAEIDVNRAWLDLAQDKRDEAETKFQAALATFRRERGNDHPRVAECLSYVARVQAKAGKKAESLASINEALTLQEASLRRTFRSPLSERNRLAVVQELRVHPESSVWPGVLDTYLELANDQNEPASGQYQRLLAWKGVIARHASPRSDELETSPEIQALAKERELRLAELRQAQLARSLGRPRLELQIEELERELARKSPRFAQGIGTTEVNVAKVTVALPPKTALLDVIEVRQFKTDDSGEVSKNFRYVGFLIRPDRPIARVEFAGSAKTINAAIKSFRTDIERRRNLKTSGTAIAKMVRDPLLPHLDGIDMLVVAGDDLINFLPMTAIPSKNPDHLYWVQDLTFGTIPSAQSLVERKERKANFAEGAVVVGGVDFVTWPKLAGTLDEANKVVLSFNQTHKGGQTELVSGSDATPNLLRELLHKRRYAHLATHGFFRADKGEGLFQTHGAAAEFDSGLVLAGPKAGKTDDILTAEEIGSLDLRGTELVVLSACESGLGRIRAGQGVIGLVAALDRAGVSSIVSTLWKVSDEGTVPFMEAFYRHLWSDSNIGPAQALRAAQLDMITGVAKSDKDATKVYKDPFYWAAFVQVGNPASSSGLK